MIFDVGVVVGMGIVVGDGICIYVVVVGESVWLIVNDEVLV